MSKKRGIILVAIVAIGVVVYFLFFHKEYSGIFEIYLDDKTYSLELSKIDRVQVDDGVIYSTRFSEGNNEIRLIFTVKVLEDGETLIDIGEPRIYIDGTSYYLRHPLRKNEYYAQMILDEYFEVCFWYPPMNNRKNLRGNFFITR